MCGIPARPSGGERRLMRVPQVSSPYPPHHTGGAERRCAGLARALADAGHEMAAPVPEVQDRHHTAGVARFDEAAP